MIFSTSSQCRRCVHFLGGKACRAFAEIPDEIWNGEVLHKQPYHNDNGVLFSAKEIPRMPDMDDELFAMITIEIQDAQLMQALAELERKAANLQPAFDAIGDTIANNIQLNIGQGITPYGQAFEPLKKQRRRQGKRRVSDVPLNDTRQHIYNRITHIASAVQVAIGMNENKPIGQTHQFGSPKKNIPARPFMPILNNQVVLPQAWKDEILTIINRHLSL